MAKSKDGRHDGKSTREAIFAAALSLAAVHGITGTTMDDIAAQAGVAKGSLYYNFASKDQLFDALLDAELGELSTRLESAGAGLSGRAAIVALVDIVLRTMEEEPDMARVLVAEIFRDDRSWVETVALHRQRFLSVFRRGCEQAVGDRPLVHPDIVAAGLFGMALMTGFEWLLNSPRAPREQVVENAMSGMDAVLTAAGRSPVRPE